MSQRGKPHKVPARVDEDDFDSHFDDEATPPKGNLFAWTVIILLLLGVAMGCWIGSFYIFGHPEKSFSYSILSKLKKLELPKRFELTAAPRGEFLTANRLFERYNKMAPRELDRANDALLRNYIRNYKLTQDLVPYVIGNYNILDSFELTDNNLFPSGVVAIAQSTENNQVLLEHVFTAEKRVISTLHRMLLTGLDIRLEKTLDLSALINVRRLPDGRLVFTAVPILYGSYVASQGPGTFSLEPPTSLNMEAGLPILDDKTLTAAEQKYASYRRKAGLEKTATASPDATPAGPKPQQQLVRVERPVPLTEPPVKRAEPVNPKPGVAPVLPPDAPTLPAVAVNPPTAPAVPIQPEPSPAPVVAQASPLDVPLQPFAEASPAASPGATPSTISASAGGNWPTYSAGQMPRGRLLNVPDMTDVANKGVGTDRVYLQGSFVVTASGQNRAVLRTQGALAENLGIGGRTGTTRVIVEFPSGAKPPSEGSSFSRDSRRPFLITDVRKGADGQVNVYVREVTKP